MSSEIAARAIEPFFTTKESGKGTGLGLSQVHGFIKQSGGHVAIYSEVGRGTTVRLYLPRARSVQAGQVAGADISTLATAAKGSPTEIILVVEDDDHVRRKSAAAIEELGYSVLAAAKGEDALRLLDAHPEITLLFTDVVMPGLNGRELFEAAHKRQPDKVLYTTGYTRNAIVHDGTLDPDVALIVKPFTVDQLPRKLRSVLDKTG